MANQKLKEAEDLKSAADAEMAEAKRREAAADQKMKQAELLEQVSATHIAQAHEDKLRAEDLWRVFQRYPLPAFPGCPGDGPAEAPGSTHGCGHIGAMSSNAN
jgi:hypothetical protein